MPTGREASVERVLEDGETRLVIRGRLDRQSAPAVRDWILAWLPQAGPAAGLDLSGVEHLDSAGVALLAESLELARARHCPLRLVRVSEPARQTLSLFRLADAPPADSRQRGELLLSLGDWLLGWLAGLRRMTLLLADVFFWAVAGPFLGGRGAPAGELTRQSTLLGSNAFGIVILLATLIGLTMALLSAAQLSQFGANIYVANLVAIAMAREMGPLMTAIIVAGRSGSAITAEIATMEVTEEVDALQAMGFSPVRFLVVPKLYAVTFTQPLLTACSVVFGILGGMLVAAVGLGVPPQAYLVQAADSLTFSDITTGLFKSLVFGWIILMVAAYCGLGARGGANEVGVRTTKSVVIAIFTVIIADCIFSLIFYL
ncbi:MAG TPA: MlaE family lipid ABC transporter permease subunit [Myxococcota bacterium]|nr:MlaE family lipid ABC transporter permease subunit [Myxococcota bacterium]HRY96324.1 MlaE family lipid ABC transporter permease subunit [Myxococcota bacterium]HSA22481.1 MlaE family lipid ABC transporter permease subunit [Myxococcota bacterium]